MSRRSSDEPVFNSDSFLDIVCNLVGIMIILIIVAGLRVSRAPVAPRDSEPAPPAPLMSPALPTARSGPPHALGGLNSLADALDLAPAAPEREQKREHDPEPAIEQPPLELIAQAENLQRQIDDSTRQLEALQQRQREAADQRIADESRLKGLEDTGQAEEQLVARLEADAAAAADKVAALEEQLAALNAEARALAADPPKPRAVAHRVTPISRQVSEKDELHFRLAGNRVSVVPLDSLAEALKLRIDRNRDLFFKLNRYEGSAGPIDGYTMRYVVERHQPSAIEELRNGGPFLRIQLAYYELQAGPDVISESANEALRPGSRFLTALLAARPGTALTFWVYPDSFELHRRLQEQAHAAGFDVAARPLPAGVPIAGSPHGSRSRAQ